MPSEALDFDDDLTTLRQLSVEPQPAGPELEAELDSRWREEHGIPDNGFRVYEGYGIDDMSLWRVRFLAKLARPSWSHGQKSKCWVRYEHGECVWRGPRSTETHTRVRKDGSVISVWAGRIEDFELTLLDSVCALAKARDKHRKTALAGAASLRASILQLQGELDKQLAYIQRVEAFRPEGTVPSDEMEAEELARKIALGDDFKAKET